MRFGSLFSGIGGLDLGLERAGMECVWQSEIDPYCSKVLAKHWPHIPNLGDITQIDWSQVEPVDLICGGYPCQPFSLAGARAGTDDARHLWPYFADAVRLLRPEWALLENVPGHLSLGFGSVQSDLADLGYDTDWDCIPAAAVGAPHLRYRIFVVAHTSRPRPRPDTRGTPSLETTNERRATQHDHVSVGDGESGRAWDVADTNHTGRGEQRRPVTNGTQLGASERGSWWTVEPDVGRVAHGIPARVDRLRSLGNAVVPQVAQYVGQRIMQAASLHRDERTPINGVLVGIPDEPACNVDQSVVDVGDELAPVGVAVNDDGDDVFHPPHNDYSSSKVKEEIA